MRAIRQFRSLTATLAFGALAACSGGSAYAPAASPANLAPLQTQSEANSESVDLAAMRLFISDAANSAVDEYDSSGKQVKTLTGLNEPQGLVTDTEGRLYVADTGDSRVAVYPISHGGPPVFLNDPNQYPIDVAFNNATGVLAVANLISTSDGVGSVSFFAKGATTPCSTISNQTQFGRVYGVAFDAEGELFVAGTDAQGNTTAGVVKGGCGAHGISPLSFRNPISGFPTLVQVNVHDQIVFSGTDGLYTFAKPNHGAFGAPLQTTRFQGGASFFALTKDGRHVWTIGGSGAAEFAYPAGGSPVASIAVSGQPIGIALLPAQTP